MQNREPVRSRKAEIPPELALTAAASAERLRAADEMLGHDLFATQHGNLRRAQPVVQDTDLLQQSRSARKLQHLLDHVVPASLDAEEQQPSQPLQMQLQNLLPKIRLKVSPIATLENPTEIIEQTVHSPLTELR